MAGTERPETQNTKLADGQVGADVSAAPVYTKDENSASIIRGLEGGQTLPPEFKTAGGSDTSIVNDSPEVKDSGNEARLKQVQDLCKLMDGAGIPDQHEQALVVTSDSWNSPTGTMWLCQRKDGHWTPTESHWAVDVGEKGMGWGDGLLQKNNDLAITKHEGDGKAPAGIFALGDSFGYNQRPPEGSKMPYRQATDNDVFVDDMKSPYYNTWQHLDPNDPKAPDPKNWDSAERMHLKDDLYSLGIVVNHNMNPAVPGDGSAIFIHEWGNYGTGTAGCTAMSDDNMRHLMSWLDPAKKPILVQLPSEPSALAEFKNTHVVRDQ
jgi:D-alanyl-D-alanine dipeptidase